MGVSFTHETTPRNVDRSCHQARMGRDGDGKLHSVSIIYPSHCTGLERPPGGPGLQLLVPDSDSDSDSE